MFVIIFVFTLFSLLQGSPVADQKINNPTLGIDGDLFPRSTHLVRREASEIVLTCLTTIFACTWTAIHPNIPSPTDSGWDIFKRRVITAFYVLLVPEAMLAWALRQNLAATRIARLYNMEIAKHNEPRSELLSRRKQIVKFLKELFFQLFDDVREWFRPRTLTSDKPGDPPRPWTTTHGFFLQMGGFVLTMNGTPAQVLGYRSPDPTDKTLGIADLIEEGKIDAPHITEDEIKDRSKSNFISKTVVLFQASWFIAQCIARWSSHLPVTQLEIVTLGFAVLNGVTYILWWNKPQDVGIPVYLTWKSLKDDIKLESDNAPCPVPRQTNVPGFLKTHFKNAVEILENSSDGFGALKLLAFTKAIYFLGVVGPYYPIHKMLQIKEQSVKKGQLRVPMFFSGSIGSDFNYTFWALVAGIGVLFGSVHFIPGWFLNFSSKPEMWLWRAFAGIITLVPLSAIQAGLLYRLLQGRLNFLGPFVPSMFSTSITSGFPAFILAHTALIILAFLSLRDLPPGALLTIQWISIVPHI